MAYSADEMRIFAYHDGYEERFVDPIEVLAGVTAILADLGGDAEKQIQQAIAGDVAVGLELANKFRPVFGLQPVGSTGGRPTGTPVLRVLTIFASFMEFIDDAKKEGEPTATCVSPTEQESSARESATASTSNST